MNKKIIIPVKEQKAKKYTNLYNKKFIFDKTNHIFIINKLFLNESFDGDTCVKRELKKKLSSYKQQDVKKKKYNAVDFIKEDELIEKLVISRLKCFYCKQPVLLIYEFSREKSQWTLDRINNDKQHSNINCVVSCLKCNLERRCLNDKKFLFTKQMRLIKKI
jgi:hypothetical protein|tara:strand:+ start:1149 stop:1634 length:486 start_codon:yes stop_codon:yes gene_type:complete